MAAESDDDTALLFNKTLWKGVKADLTRAPRTMITVICRTLVQALLACILAPFAAQWTQYWEEELEGREEPMHLCAV